MIAIVIAVVNLAERRRRRQGDAPHHPGRRHRQGAGHARTLRNRSSVDWGPKCDVARGTVAVPLTYAPPCVKPFTGDNGGATAPGVTGTEITVALYQAQPDILQQAALARSGSDASLAAEAATVQQYIHFFESYYETYGRKVKLVVVKASGAPDDDAAARADAIRVATEIKAFASFGGPGETEAYAQELAARGVLCLGDCMLASSRVVRRPARAEHLAHAARRRPVGHALGELRRPPARRPPGAVRGRREARRRSGASSGSCASTSPSPGSSRPARRSSGS